MTVNLGSERLLDSNRLDGRCIGVVCNPSSVDRELRHITDRVAAHPGAKLAAIFGPQHGFRSDVQENMIETGHTRDDRRRVPVYSLYSETREPTPDMLRDLDVLVIDLQDVGVRIYTYIYTLANCLKAARTHGLEVIVCDRPSPRLRLRRDGHRRGSAESGLRVQPVPDGRTRADGQRSAAQTGRRIRRRWRLRRQSGRWWRRTPRAALVRADP
jgi:uncharacterized protein YbbC (DUF1343 family)